MFLCSLLTFAQFSGSGSGTESDPYLILSPIQLNQIRNFQNQSNVYFKLMADIDLTEFLEDENPDQGWQPIGTSSSPFKGILDGNGKIISGLNISRGATNYIGFFGYTNGATISSLTLKGNVSGKDYVAGFVAYAVSTTINNCNFEGNIQGQTFTGGYIGYATDGCQITNCSFIDGNVIASSNYVGGICGSAYSENTIKSCRVTADVTGSYYIGGICGDSSGQRYTVSIFNCSFVGDVYGNSYVGGVIGRMYRYADGWDYISKVSGCYAIGTILAQGNYVGGIAGYDLGVYWYSSKYHQSPYRKTEMLDCYFCGHVSGLDQVGGIVGYKKYGYVMNCYCMGFITGCKQVGGIVGYCDDGTDIKKTVAFNSYITASEGHVARIVGFDANTVSGHVGVIGTSEENKSYNRTVVISQGSTRDVSDDLQNGTGVSAKTLKLKATYVAMEWDFNDVWAIQETECFPYMKRQTAPPVIQSQVVSGATTISGKCVDGGTVSLEIDDVKQQMVSKGHEFSFTVSPLQAGHEVRLSAKAEGKEQSYYTTETVAYLGKGTEADPYQVYTASDLTGVYRKGFFKLMNDIDLTDYINQFSPTEGWESIGREGSETIHFDGDGHKITGLWCNSNRNNTGLFSCFANGTIKNLTVETAKNKEVKGGANTGILIGKMINGTIENCRVSGSVADGTPVGGMVGFFDGGTISCCHTNVAISTTLADSYFGSLAGEITSAHIDKCSSAGTLIATGTGSYVGGLVGEITGGTINQCITTGTILMSGTESYAGGLIGKNYATITNSYSTATITSSYNAAGVVAYNYGMVDKCYATGNLYSSNYAAGIIGYNDGANAIVKNCMAMNNKIDVTYESQQQQQSGGYGQRIIGGIKNGAPAPELNNYALKTMQVSVNNVPQKVYDDIMNGVGKNASDLLKASTYQELGWNFTDIWTINENENYPLLKNNTGAVVEPGEDPNQDPILSDDDKIVVAEVMFTKGQQAIIGIDLENKTTNLTAYQFDLTLPDGVSLSLNDKGKFLVTKTSRYDDDNQTLNISKMDGNSYRFVSFSMSNEIITGTSGAILNASLTVGESVNVGSYEAKISNIVVTKTDGTQLKLKDSKFNIVVTNVIKGDANGDGEVNVSDIVEIVNYIMGKPSANFVQAAADLNGDGEVNVTDIVKVVSIIMSTNGNEASVRAYVTDMADNDRLTLSVDDDNVFSLCLDNEDQYVATQFDLRLAEGQKLESISSNSNRGDGHIITYAKTGDNLYKVLVYSLTNESFAGNCGQLIDFMITGIGNVSIENIIFVTAGHQEKRFAPLGSGTTGIDRSEELRMKSEELATSQWYTLDGRKLNKQSSKKGIYIMNGKKLVVK